MYDYLLGELTFYDEQMITLEVNGVGFSLHLASSSLQALVGEAWKKKEKKMALLPHSVKQMTSTGKGLERVAAMESNGDRKEAAVSEYQHDRTMDEQQFHFKLYIHSQQSETAHHLFAFAFRAERELFRLLMTVSGVGARLAARIMLSSDAKALCSAIESGNQAALGEVRGLGKRTAEKMIVELRQKMGPLYGHFGYEEGERHRLETSSSFSTMQEEALLALKHLGYKETELLPLLEEVFNGEKVPESLEEAITRILRAIKN